MGAGHAMNILSYNPGHDGAIAYLKEAQLQVSIEAEKNSNWRYSPVSSYEVFSVLGAIDEIPDVVCTGGWWPREHRALGSNALAGYRGVSGSDVIIERRRLMGRSIHYFSSSHERSHVLCAFGLSSLPKGTPCLRLGMGRSNRRLFTRSILILNITLLADVLNQPGNRYIALYGLADPTFPKNAPFSRFSDAGKLMALTSFAKRKVPLAEEEELIDLLRLSPYISGSKLVQRTWSISAVFRRRVR